MLHQKPKPKNIEEYIAAAPGSVQGKLQQMQEYICAAAPGPEGLK